MRSADYPCAFAHWGEEERTAIARVLASGKFTMGEEVQCFEAEFAAWHGMRHGIMCNSGSSANLLAVAALFHKAETPLRPGDKAIVPAIAWATTYAPLVQHGLDLILCDVDETWCANARDMHLSRNIYGAKLVIGCSILGNPTNLPQWQMTAEGLGAHFIEDNCESLGASTASSLALSRHGPLCGTFGLMNTFSFYFSHQISAIEGGMILTDDDEMNALCRMLRDHGMTRWRKPKNFDEEYDFRLMGYNLRPVELHAAIAREQLAKLPAFTQARRENADFWRELTADLPINHPRINGDWNPFGLHFAVKDSETRARLVAALRENGIDCRLPTGGSFRLHRYAERWANQATPNADRVHRTGLFLGNAPFDISDKIEKAVQVMRVVL